MKRLRNDTDPGADPAGRHGALWLLSVALICGMSTWFSATAVVPQLTDVWDLSSSQKAWLTIAVQLGFVAGALVSAVFNVADRVRPQVLILAGCVGAGLANLGLVWSGGAGAGIPLRFMTGFFMAGVYPPAFKLISTWFRRGRGGALGVLAGAIILGNAMPHLVNAVGGLDWRTVVWATSGLSAAGGMAAILTRDGPFPFPVSRFDPAQIARVFANRGVRLASIGYFGHMWELFAMYAWFQVFLTDHFAEGSGGSISVAAAITFAVIAAGSFGSIVAGLMADRWGRSNTTTLMLAVSGLCSISIGLLFGGSTVLIVAVGLVWGFAVVADSAQFSAIVTETGDQSYVGTALTLQVAVGFTVTVATIWLIPILESAVTWRWAFAVLAAGPLVGIVAMQRLRNSPEAALIAGGRG